MPPSPVWLCGVGHGLSKIHGSSKHFHLLVEQGLWLSSADTLVSRASFVSRASVCQSGPVQQGSGAESAEGNDLEEGRVGGCQLLCISSLCLWPFLTQSETAMQRLCSDCTKVIHHSLTCHCRLDATFLEFHINGIIQSLLLCSWLLLSRFFKCTGISVCDYSFLFIAMQYSIINILVYLPIS